MDLCWFSLGDHASYLRVQTGRQRISLAGVAFKLQEVRTAVSAQGEPGSPSDMQMVLAQLPAAFEHFNEVHPHSSLKMRSPREFRRQQAAGAEQALYCE
jgi:transposase InsO family protein